MMLPKSFDEALLTEFFSRVVERFGHPIRIEHQRVTWEQAALPNSTTPLLGQSQDGACGIEPFKVVIVPEEQGGKMATVRVP